MAITILTPEQMLKNLAALTIQLTEKTRHNVGRNSSNYGNASKGQIAEVSRQLAETVLTYLAGELEPEVYDDEIPF